MTDVRASLRTEFCALLLALAAFGLPGCHRVDPPADPALASATRFVEGFYAWYVPAAQNGWGLQVATLDSARLFAPALLAALRADGEAQAANPDEVVGLDGDPFLDAQDFCEEYHAGAAHRKGGAILVDVHGTCTHHADGQADVIAEVGGRDGALAFVNFRYPGRGSDLIKDLDLLRRERETKR